MIKTLFSFYNLSIGLIGFVLNTTSVSCSNISKTTVSPTSSPRVLNNPSTISFVSYCQNSVIKIFSTLRNYCTWLISTPIGSINSNSDWIICNGTLHVWSWNSFDTSWLILSCLEFTILVLSNIWICSSCLDTILCSPWDSHVFKTTITTIWWFITINQLLFRQIWICWIFSLTSSESWFHCSNSWEGPAWTTISLIFYFCQWWPISRCSWGICWNIFLNAFNFHWFSCQIDSNKFLLGQVCELVFSHSVWVWWICIKSLNVFHFLFINLLSVKFFNWCVNFTILDDVIFKSHLIINWVLVLQLVNTNCKECYGC
jgi:hypothetical protein